MIGSAAGVGRSGWPALATRILRWAFVATPARKASVGESLAVTLGITLVGLALCAALLKPPTNVVTEDQHAMLSLDLGINWVVCGKYGMLSGPYDLAHYLLAHIAETRPLSVPSILERVAGSRDRYCAAVTTPFLNNENSLFYIFSALLWIHPNVTLDGLGVVLTWLRIAGIVFFVFALVCVGASPVFALLALMLGAEITGLLAPTHLYSSYPFLLPFLGVYTALLALTLHFGVHRNRRHLALAAFGIGLFGAFFYNLRSSYLPIVAACYLIFVAVVWRHAVRRDESGGSSRWTAAGIATAGFALGGVLFYLAFTYPLTRSGANYNYTHHVVAHPLVLSLAVPPNALSEREGIKWSDVVGPELARTVDPTASYLGPTYERALLTYYTRLWRRYPREMLDIYLAKWRLSTTGSVTFVDDRMGSWAQLLLGPTRLLNSGIGYSALFLFTTIGAMYLADRYHPAAGILGASLAAAAFFVTLESAIIMPLFYLQYHNAQLWVLFLINLLCYQAVVNGASRTLSGRTSRATTAAVQEIEGRHGH